ncbi:hypothetical protein Taro_027944 [Colocasia esculenta]|uniref:Uncharacterized protein n=1 Tax=Colocasia esculenta TaxID=4460 RepID=A0A843VFW7_COLES|nr:hypothetical protein [Colocasia esculenta]
MWRTQWEGFHLRRPRVYADRVRLPVCTGRPGDRVHLPVHTDHPSDRVCLPVHAGRPSDRVRLLPSSVTFPIPITNRAIIQRRMRRGLSYLDASHAGFLGKLDHFKLIFMYKINVQLQGEDRSRFCLPLYYIVGPRHTFQGQWTHGKSSPHPFGNYYLTCSRYVFTRPEDLPRARVVWESTTQTNFRKSMWEARDKATKTTSSRDPTAWMDYSPMWLRRDYWEFLYHRWATGPWQERSHRHELERAPTFNELFDRTHKQKGTDDYVSESARTIAETYYRTMADRYAEGTPQPDLNPEAWVDAAGGPRKGRVYG